MMKKALTTALIAVGTTLVLPGTPARADTPNCVTRAEYRAVKNGWTRARVARVFDVPGRQMTGLRPGFHARTYNDCWRSREYEFVSVIYRFRAGAWRVVDKRTDFWHP